MGENARATNWPVIVSMSVGLALGPPLGAMGIPGGDPADVIIGAVFGAILGCLTGLAFGACLGAWLTAALRPDRQGFTVYGLVVAGACVAWMWYRWHGLLDIEWMTSLTEVLLAAWLVWQPLGWLGRRHAALSQALGEPVSSHLPELESIRDDAMTLRPGPVNPSPLQMESAMRIVSIATQSFSKTAEQARSLFSRKPVAAWAGVALVCFALFVWPTLHRYEKVRRSTYEEVWKINRITGNAVKVIDPTKVAPPALTDVTKAAVPKCDIYVERFSSDFHGRIYNGWTAPIRRIVVRLQTVAWTRDVAVDLNAPALATTRFTLPITDPSATNREAGWESPFSVTVVSLWAD
jgi:hypothetical protein